MSACMCAPVSMHRQTAWLECASCFTAPPALGTPHARQGCVHVCVCSAAYNALSVQQHRHIHASFMLCMRRTTWLACAISSIAPTLVGTTHAQLQNTCLCTYLNAQTDDLARMYRLFHRIPKGLEPVAEIFKQHVEAEGNKLVKEVSEDVESKKQEGGWQGHPGVGCGVLPASVSHES